MKRTVLALFLISIVIVAAAWVILSQTRNQVEKQTYDVKVADFKWTSNWGPGPVNVLWGRSFNVTLRNLGTADAEDVRIEVKLLTNNSEIRSETWFDELEIEAGEIHEFDGAFMTAMDELDNAQGELTYKVVCMMNSTILDELTLPSN